MTKNLFVFVLLIAFAMTQDDQSNDVIIDSSIENQDIQTLTTTSSSSVQISNSVRTVSNSVTFDGEYTTSISNDPDLRIRFSGNQISIINGCNSFNGQYQANSTGCIKFGQLAGTKRACQVDFDSLYTTAIANSVTFEIQGSRIIFRDSRKIITITLTKYTGSNGGSTGTPISLAGKYRTNLLNNNPNVYVEITDTKFNLIGGCNNQGGSYKAFSDGTFSTGNFFSTQKACSVDNDAVYSKALIQSTSFTKNADGSITFRNSKGQITVILTPVNINGGGNSNGNEIKLNGAYKPSINDNPDILIQFDSNNNRVSLLNGCNTVTGSYKAYDSGSIAFSQFASTRKFCNNDKDSIYTNALSNCVRFVIQGNQILLYSSSGQLIMTLTPVGNNPPSTATPISLAGNYTTNLSNNPNIYFQITDSQINLIGGCNNQGGSYRALSDGSFSTGNFFSTQRACITDNDTSYTGALTQSTSFTKNADGSITFRNSNGQITIILILRSTTPTNPSGCKANQVLTPSGCWNSCSDPRFNQCPNVFAALYNPSFCAYTRNGIYVSDTYECQACKRQDAYAVRSGACSCDFIKCGTNEVCQNGQCIKSTPVTPSPTPCNKLCIQGTICQNGQCVTDPSIDKCALIRCGFGTVCRNGQCVQPSPVDACANVRCQSGYVCQNGQCVLSDRCSLVRCSTGQECRNGECVQIQGYCGSRICSQGEICSKNQCVPCNYQQCNSDFQCRNGEFCQNGACVSNKCLTVKCYAGAHCDNGKCVPDIQNLPSFNSQLPGAPSFQFSSGLGATDIFSQTQTGFGSFGQNSFSSGLSNQNSFTNGFGNSFGNTFSNGLGSGVSNNFGNNLNNGLGNGNSFGNGFSNGFGNGFNGGFGNGFGQFNQDGLSQFQGFNSRDQQPGQVCGTTTCLLGTFCKNGKCVATIPSNLGSSSSSSQATVLDCAQCPDAPCLNNVCFFG